MRTNLHKLNIVGAVMIFQEGEYCRQTLEWLCNYCDRVIILLDNHDGDTEQIAFEYKDRFNGKVNLIYSTEPVNLDKNVIQGQIKKRFKLRQNFIREQVIDKLKELHKEWPVDLFIFLDSDEVPINQFPEVLEEFWDRPERYMMTGFVEPFEDYQTLIYQKMSPHGRVYKYDPEISAHPYTTRTRYNPYGKERAWKVRNLIVHLCHFDEGRRKRRQFFDNVDFVNESAGFDVWKLPKDVREMTYKELADYQPGAHGAESVFKPIKIEEYLKNKK